MQSFIDRRGHEIGMGRQQNRCGVGKARVIQKQTWSASGETISNRAQQREIIHKQEIVQARCKHNPRQPGKG